MQTPDAQQGRQWWHLGLYGIGWGAGLVLTGWLYWHGWWLAGTLVLGDLAVFGAGLPAPRRGLVAVGVALGQTGLLVGTVWALWSILLASSFPREAIRTCRAWGWPGC